MAPVLAITGMVARTFDADSSLTPLERFINQSSPGRPDPNFFDRSRDNDRQKAVAEPEGEKRVGITGPTGSEFFRSESG
jgi:hypothetical protein